MSREEFRKGSGQTDGGSGWEGEKLEVSERSWFRV